MKINQLFKYSIHLLIIALLVGFSGYHIASLQPEEGTTTFVTKEGTLNMKFSVIEVAYFVYAAENGDTETVKKFIELGIDVNQKDHNDDTAIMGAALNGHKDIVSILMANQADPKVKNNQGFDAFEFGKIHNRAETLSLLSSPDSSLRILSSVDKGE